MAAVALARRTGAEVFATAGSDRKREFLTDLGVHHVMDSRSTTFADEILALTAGRGVDIVLNSLAGSAIRCQLRRPPAGRRLPRDRQGRHVGRRAARRVAGTRALRRVRSRRALRARARSRALDARRDARHARRRHPAAAALESFDATHAVAAFRHMARARHIGKVVLRFDADTSSGDVDTLIRPDATYLVTGGLGTLGSRTLDGCRGARHRATSSPSAGTSTTPRSPR